MGFWWFSNSNFGPGVAKHVVACSTALDKTQGWIVGGFIVASVVLSAVWESQENCAKVATKFKNIWQKTSWDILRYENLGESSTAAVNLLQSRCIWPVTIATNHSSNPVFDYILALTIAGRENVVVFFHSVPCSISVNSFMPTNFGIRQIDKDWTAIQPFSNHGTSKVFSGFEGFDPWYHSWIYSGCLIPTMRLHRQLAV